MANKLESSPSYHIISLFRQIGLKGCAEHFEATEEEMSQKLAQLGVCVGCNS